MTSQAFRNARFGVLSVVLAAVFASVFLSGAVSASAAYNPALVISDSNMRHYDSMSEKEIQKFLESQPGLLKSLTTTDHAGVKRKASKIIYDACQKWKISPKVMLVMLQKEQSLLTKTKSQLGKNTLARAIGAGCPDAKTNRFPGFGNQIWHGARLLDAYGEGKTQTTDGKTYKSTIPLFKPGILKLLYKTNETGSWLVKKTVTKSGKKTTSYYLKPKSLATYKLFVYNPSVRPGNYNFYNYYNKYFGSPTGSPRYKTVYRFRNKQNGTYLYTTSSAERYTLRTVAKYKKRWAYQGAKFKIDTQVPEKGTIPVYRFRNKKTGKQSYTISSAKYKQRTSKAGKKTWSYSGVAFRVTKKKTTPNAVAIYKFYNKKTGAYFLTHSKATKDKFRTKSYKKKWRYEGIAYYLPRVSTAIPAKK